MSGFLFYMVLFSTIALVIGLPVLLGVYGYRWLKHKGHTKAAPFIPMLILGTLFYFIYTSVYPTQGFYINDFETNTAFSFPPSGIFPEKDATYPDIHGDYTAKAIIQFSQQDYRSVYQKLRADKQFQVDTGSYHF